MRPQVIEPKELKEKDKELFLESVDEKFRVSIYFFISFNFWISIFWPIPWMKGLVYLLFILYDVIHLLWTGAVLLKTGNNQLTLFGPRTQLIFLYVDLWKYYLTAHL